MTHPHTPVRIPNDPAPLDGCGYPDRRNKRTGLCEKPPVAYYTNPFSRALNTARCEHHARDIASRRAAEMGFRRVLLHVEPTEKASRIRALAYVEEAAA